MELRVTGQVSTTDAAGIRTLAWSARDVDGIDPLSEQTLLSLDGAPGPGAHITIVEAEGPTGYAFVERPGRAGSGAELVVAPSARRRGLGRQLLHAVSDQAPDVRVWAHGNLPQAQAFARSEGLVVVRELVKMHRPLRQGDEFRTELPPGFTARTFTPADIDTWIEVNSAAFASHPEQGRMTAQDVKARMGEPWFDPQGFFLVFDEREEAPRTSGEPSTRKARLAAFHWTKTVQDEGEVYVVGVHPDYQGLGLGGSVTALGLAYLHDRGLPTVTLYVEGDNEAALHTYKRQGFTRRSTDVMYARPRTEGA